MKIQCTNSSTKDVLQELNNLQNEYRKCLDFYSNLAKNELNAYKNLNFLYKFFNYSPDHLFGNGKYHWINQDCIYTYNQLNELIKKVELAVKSKGNAILSDSELDLLLSINKQIANLMENTICKE